ncbi:ABC transporter permease [Planctomycetaceae bacterium SH139]
MNESKKASKTAETAEANGPTTPLILHDVSVYAGGRKLLDHTSVKIPDGEITVIVGGSGAGKSVLLRIFAGLIGRDDPVLPWSGSIDHGEGRPLGRVGIVFQQFALFDELSATGNVRFAIDHRRRQDIAPEQSASEWLDELRVPQQVPVSALSGGQKQRLAIARTLAADPEIVLYDEPTSGLDAASGRQVAELIRRTQRTHRRTSVVVTHDYETLLPIADTVLLLDATTLQLVPVDKQDWAEIPNRMQPVQQQPTSRTPASVDGANADEPTSTLTSTLASTPAATPTTATGSRWSLPVLSKWSGEQLLAGMTTTGEALICIARAPWDLIPKWPRGIWGLRFLGHYLRLVCGPSAWVYLLMSGLIVGFTSTYFTFKFLPYDLYTKPLLLEDLLAAIGFALYRVLVPVLATILIAARCGAAVAADVGVKRYGSQVEALQTLGIAARAYLLTPILLAFVIGTPLLTWLAFWSAKSISLVSFLAAHPERGAYFWDLYFSDQLRQPNSFFYDGFGWLILKTVLCGLGVGLIAYYRGVRPKQSARDVSEAITSTVLWATLYVLMIHFIIAFFEF